MILESALQIAITPTTGLVYATSEDASFSAGVVAVSESLQLKCHVMDSIDGVCFEQLNRPSCVVMDCENHGRVLDQLRNYDKRHFSPVVVCLGHGDVSATAKLFRAGAFAIVEKPLQGSHLAAEILQAISVDRAKQAKIERRNDLHQRFSSLTARQLQVLNYLLQGKSNKWIADALCVSKRTVDLDRHQIMVRTQSESPTELARNSVEYCMFSDQLRLASIVSLEWSIPTDNCC
jgi:FixJ family two-component response regulator